MKKPAIIKTTLTLLPFCIIIWLDIIIADPSVVNLTGTAMASALFISIALNIKLLRLVSGYLSILINITLFFLFIHSMFFSKNGEASGSGYILYGSMYLLMVFICWSVLFYRPVVEFYKVDSSA